MITYQEIINITHSPEILISLILVWLLPIILYLTIGFFIRTKTTKRRMWSHPNYWHFIWIWGIIQAGLILGLVIFPLWSLFS